MEKYYFKPVVRKILADTVTPVSVYLRLRHLYQKSILLESSDYRGHENAYSFICFEPIACFTADNGEVTIERNGSGKNIYQITADSPLHQLLNEFYNSFEVNGEGIELPANGLFGYMAYDAVRYFEKLELTFTADEKYRVPEARYCFYKYVIAIDHHKNVIHMVENLREGEKSQLDYIHHLLVNLNFLVNGFATTGDERTNISDEQFKKMVTKGKDDCKSGEITQVVLARQFSQDFSGDDFNVYRSLRSINPSPYLFYFDYGNFKIFGSSPEAQLRVTKGKAYIHPIAGTFRRTGNDEQDRELAEQLCLDPKENAEHVMLVDLAKDDLSKSTTDVKVEAFREVQFYSHVIHLVSQVSGKLPPNANLVKLLGESFPAGTLSGAPKLKALQLIDMQENQRRGFYGGCIGYLGFDRTLNHAIIIRSFLSKNSTLYYQAGAGVVAESTEDNELQEVNNKLAALKKAIEMANAMGK